MPIISEIHSLFFLVSNTKLAHFKYTTSAFVSGQLENWNEPDIRYDEKLFFQASFCVVFVFLILKPN